MGSRASIDSAAEQASSRSAGPFVTSSILFTAGDRWFHDANALTRLRSKRPDGPPVDLQLLRAPVDLVVDGQAALGSTPDEPILAFLTSLVASVVPLTAGTLTAAEVAFQESPSRIALVVRPRGAAELSVYRVTRGGALTFATDLDSTAAWCAAAGAFLGAISELADALDEGPVRDAVLNALGGLHQQMRAPPPHTRRAPLSARTARPRCVIETQSGNGVTLVTTLEEPSLLLDYTPALEPVQLRTLLLAGHVALLPDECPGVRIEGFPLLMLAGVVADIAERSDAPELVGGVARLRFDRGAAAAVVDQAGAQWRWSCDIGDVLDLLADHARRVVDVLVAANPALASHSALHTMLLEMRPHPAPRRRGREHVESEPPSPPAPPPPFDRGASLRQLTLRPVWEQTLRGRAARHLIAHEGTFWYLRGTLLEAVRVGAVAPVLAVSVAPPSDYPIALRSGDLIWATHADGGVQAIDARSLQDDARVVLHRRIDQMWPLDDSGDVLLLSGEVLHRVDRHAVRWSAHVGAHRGDVLSTSDRVVFVAPTGVTYVLDRSTGERVALATLPNSCAFFDVSGRFLIAFGVGETSSVTLVAVDLDDGRFVASLALEVGSALTRPRFSGRAAFIAVTTPSEHSLVRFDPDSRRFVRLRGPSFDPTARAVWADSERVVFASRDVLWSLVAVGQSAVRAWSTTGAARRPWHTMATPPDREPQAIAIADGGDVRWVSLRSGRTLASLVDFADVDASLELVTGADYAVFGQASLPSRHVLTAWTPAGFLAVVPTGARRA